MATFRRQLAAHGFRQIYRGENVGAYYHPHFLRGRDDLVDLVAAAAAEYSDDDNVPVKAAVEDAPSSSAAAAAAAASVMSSSSSSSSLASRDSLSEMQPPKKRTCVDDDAFDTDAIAQAMAKTSHVLGPVPSVFRSTFPVDASVVDDDDDVAGWRPLSVVPAAVETAGRSDAAADVKKAAATAAAAVAVKEDALSSVASVTKKFAEMHNKTEFQTNDEMFSELTVIHQTAA